MCEFCDALTQGQPVDGKKATLDLPKDLEPRLDGEGNEWVIPLDKVSHVVATELRRLASNGQTLARDPLVALAPVPYGVAVIQLAQALEQWANVLDPVVAA